MQPSPEYIENIIKYKYVNEFPPKRLGHRDKPWEPIMRQKLMLDKKYEITPLDDAHVYLRYGHNKEILMPRSLIGKYFERVEMSSRRTFGGKKKRQTKKRRRTHIRRRKYKTKKQL